MIERMDLKEFKDTGMLWYINQQLHLFGMALVIEEDENGMLKELYPAKCKFRGFSNSVSDKGYRKLTEYMVENSEDLLKDCE